MISPELLKRYPFFGSLDEPQLKRIASICDEVKLEAGQVIFEECDTAETLYLLEEGSVELFYRFLKAAEPPKQFYVGDINPGEVFGISSLIEPYALNATAKAAHPGKAIKVKAEALRQLMEKDPVLGYRLMIQTTRTTMERLAALRVQFAGS